MTEWTQLIEGADLGVIADVFLSKIEEDKANPIWIRKAARGQVMEQVAAVEARRKAGEELPLYGHFFAAKDNIDVAWQVTTAGCPAYAYTPEESAPVVQKVMAAGAVFLGKTNMDQFATGLVGTRSPYGPCCNPFNPEFISGGSSSGSAVAVARGMASFSFGTDTAGSGRVPAAFNGLVGYKPTRGLLSTRGVVPACRSLDCVSIFARTVAHVKKAAAVAGGYDPLDPFSRPAPDSLPPPAGKGFRLGVPQALEFFGDPEAELLFNNAVREFERVGGECVAVDYTPFAEAAALLYQGPWVSERYAAVGEWMAQHPQECDPTVAGIIAGGRDLKAVDAFRSQYRLRELRRRTEPLWEAIDALLLPTVPAAYRIAEVQANPVELNSRLGTYTNFVNLLDLCALALPSGKWSHGVRFGVTLAAPAFADARLFSLGQRFLREPEEPAAPGGQVLLAVVGAHLEGFPLHGQLVERKARLAARTRTSARYRLFALEGARPAKPGLIRDEARGAPIEVEVYALDEASFGSFVRLVPAPLAIGNVELQDGTWVKGFVCEGHAVASARDITSCGGWRAYCRKDPGVAK
jgi:allophanate hydrolase